MAQRESGDNSGGNGRLPGLLVIVALVVVALLMARTLRQSSQDGDCLLQGRSDCNHSITASPGR